MNTEKVSSLISESQLGIIREFERELRLDLSSQLDGVTRELADALIAGLAVKSESVRAWGTSRTEPAWIRRAVRSTTNTARNVRRDG